MISIRAIPWRPVAAVAAVALVAASATTFLGDDDAPAGPGVALAVAPVESGLPTNATPQRGGQVVYGLEAETSGGFCLPESQLAMSGLQIVRSLYDPLVTPDADGGYVPYLAKSVTPDESFRSWMITLRPGITFHDGSILDAQVVKNNLDAYRGAYPARSALLFAFVFQNIESVSVVNELTVEVKTKVPWVAFPAALYGSGRVAMVAQAQLDADEAQCQRQPIGTGPFRFVSWTPDVSLRVARNANYWQEAPDGKPYPYLDGIDFRPMPNSDARLAALQEGELNMLHTSTMSDMASNLISQRDEGAINLLISEERTETNYLMMNVTDPRLAKREVRVAIAHAIDRRHLNQAANDGFASLATGPFAPEVAGYLRDNGSPSFDLDSAKKAVADMKARGEDTTLRLLTSIGPAAVRTGVLQKRMLEDAGFTVILETETEADLIQKVIAGDYDLAAFRNQPGDDPDSNYHWWHGGGNPVNFGRFNDPEINAALEAGRISADPQARTEAYERVNQRFGQQVYNVYLWYASWAVAEAPDVHGILGPPLPDDGGPAPARIVTGHPMLGLWIDRD